MAGEADISVKASILGTDAAIKAIQQLINTVDDLNKAFNRASDMGEARAKQRVEERAAEAKAKAVKAAEKEVTAALLSEKKTLEQVTALGNKLEASRAAEAKKVAAEQAKASAAIIKSALATAAEVEKAAKQEEAARNKATKAAQKQAEEVEAAQKKQRESILAGLRTVLGAVGSIIGSIVEIIAVAVGAITALVGAIYGALAGIALFTGNFQAQMARVGALTGATTDEMNRMEKQAINLSRGFTYTATEVGVVQEKIGTAGVALSQVTDEVVKQTLALATLTRGELELGNVADYVGGVMTAFGIRADEVSRITNALAAVSTGSAITVADLVKSMRQAASISELAGAKYEDLVVILGLMGQELIKGSDAGTSLKQMYISLMRAQGPALEMMQKYHIGLIDANGQQLAAIDIIKNLQKELGKEAVAAGKVTEQDRLQALAVIFGTDAMRAAVIMAQLDTAAWDAMSRSLTDSSKSATTMADKINASLIPQLTILKNNIEAIVLTLAGPLTKKLGDFVAGINQTLQQIDMTKIQVLGQYISDVFTTGKGDAQGLADTFGPLANNINRVVMVIKDLLDWTVRIGSAIATLATSAANVASSFLDVSTNANAIKDSAVLGFFEKVILYAAAIVENLPGIAEVILDIANVIVSFAKAGYAAFKSFWDSVVVKTGEAINNIAKVISEGLAEIARMINEFTSSMSPLMQTMFFGGPAKPITVSKPKPVAIGPIDTGRTDIPRILSPAEQAEEEANKAWKKLEEDFDRTRKKIEQDAQAGSKKMEEFFKTTATNINALKKVTTSLRPFNEMPPGSAGTSKATGATAIPPNALGGGGEQNLDEITKLVMQLLKGFPLLNQETAEFIAKIAQSSPERLQPMVKAMRSVEGSMGNLVIAARNYVATQVQIVQSEQRLAMLRAQQAAITARIAIIQAEANLRMLPLQREMLQLDMQIASIRNQVSIIDERINQLTRENLTLKLEQAQIEANLIDRRNRIAQIDFKIGQAQRKAVELIAQRTTLENQVLPVRQRIAQLERQSAQMEDKRVKLLNEEKQIRLDISRVGIENQLKHTEANLQKAWERMDIGAILQLETQKVGQEDQLSAVQQNIDDLTTEQTLIELNTQLAQNYIAQQIVGYEQLIQAQEDQIFILQQQEELYNSNAAVVIANLELEKQQILDTMAPELERLALIEQQKAAEQARVAAAVVLLQMEKQALEDQLGPLERRRTEIGLQIQQIQLEVAEITAQMQLEAAHLALAIAQEEARRADLEVTRLKQEEVYTELIEEFASALAASGAFTLEEALEVAKRLGFWNDQIEKMGQLITKFSDLEAEAIRVKAAIDAIPKNVTIVITTVHRDEYQSSYQHGGTVPGPYGKPVMVMAHGGERFLGMAHSPMQSTERMINTTNNNGSVTDSHDITVNANYANRQSPSSIRMDLASITAGARR